ncbi:cell envelope integrity protein TolA [Paucibacter sp. KBW04]|uniref:cell envelope integrity protein TolA n=1 Tax=Paucibacter sp. KBW04 TaxID=2153361 RepID=UPI000F57C830|nr:cell envelope integrity protein TolA [Paucibacter sp. KBW04]RQO55304.1 cell envelope integrity protein TolA [Paucibacter sp. KBW04]
MTSPSLSPAFAPDPLRPPDNPGLGRGFAIAAIAHAALLAALSAGVHWRSETPPAFEAELWSAVPQAAAPKEQLPPEPEPEAEPTPPPKPVLAPPPPPPAEDLQAEREAEIAIAKAKEKKKQEQLEAKREAEREALRKKEELAKKEKEKEREKEREKAEKKAAEEKEKQKQEKLEKQKQDKLAKEAAAKKDAAREAKAEAQRQENLRRIQGMAGATGAPNATGSALQSSGPSANYAGRIKARVRPNIIYPDTGAANPVAEVEVRTAPDGNIISRKILKASGDTEWDNAVLRAIDKTAVLPRDTDGRVPSVLIISFKPRE